MEYNKTLKNTIDSKISNYGSYKNAFDKLLDNLKKNKDSVSNIKSDSLAYEVKLRILLELFHKGIFNSFFSDEYSEVNFQKILIDIKKTISSHVPLTESSIVNKFQSVAWLRDDEEPAETYSFYNSANNNTALYAKVGLNQRSYKIWSNGNSDGDYIDVYYNHLHNIQQHSFFPHNDRRFSHVTSNYLSTNSEAREYLLKREEIWKSMHKASISLDKFFIEKIFAFGYLFSNEQINLSIEKELTNNTLLITLLSQIQMDKEKFGHVLKKYGNFDVRNDFSFIAAFGEDFQIKEEELSTNIKATNAFYKLKNSITNAKQEISEVLKKHNSLVTASFTEDMLFQLFIDILIYHIDQEISSFQTFEAMVRLQQNIAQKINQLNKEVIRLKKLTIDLNNEAIIINRMNAQLIEWHKSIDIKISNLNSDTNEDEALNNRIL